MVRKLKANNSKLGNSVDEGIELENCLHHYLGASKALLPISKLVYESNALLVNANVAVYQGCSIHISCYERHCCTQFDLCLLISPGSQILCRNRPCLLMISWQFPSGWLDCTTYLWELRN